MNHSSLASATCLFWFSFRFLEQGRKGWERHTRFGKGMRKVAKVDKRSLQGSRKADLPCEHLVTFQRPFGGLSGTLYFTEGLHGSDRDTFRVVQVESDAKNRNKTSQKFTRKLRGLRGREWIDFLNDLRFLSNAHLFSSLHPLSISSRQRPFVEIRPLDNIYSLLLAITICSGRQRSIYTLSDP